jgi:hypothetical protein
MAAFPASQGPQLEGMAAAIGVFPQYIAQQSETLILKEKVLSLSGDSFSIKTIDGRPIFQVKGNAFSLSGRKAVSDMAGNVLFELRKKHIAIHSTYYAVNASDQQFFQVASKFKRTYHFSNTLQRVDRYADLLLQCSAAKPLAPSPLPNPERLNPSSCLATSSTRPPTSSTRARARLSPASIDLS